MAAADPEGWVVVDGNASPEAVAAEVRRAVDAVLPPSGDDDAVSGRR